MHGLGDRERQMEWLADERFDVAVVGGGISGAGIALDLAARGVRVALVERADFASGASSRSSKLIHGGLRYLARYQFGVTREALHERHVLLRIAPALVEPLLFVLPVVGGLFEAARVALGLALYDALAGSENTCHFAHIRRVDLHALAPGLDTSRLTTAYVYHDCRTDDARLTLAVLRKAHALGATLVNYLEVESLVHEHGRARGLRVRDRLGTAAFDVRADCVVLATGAWGDRALRAPGVAPAARVRPSKGVHLFFPRERLDPRVALYLPTGIDDRLVFVVPWDGRTLVGTTDTEYEGPIDRPSVEPADVEYLLGVLNRAFPDRRLAADDVVGAQAGIRPLVQTNGSTAHASREERIWERADGAVVIAGGKLTTFRRMAEKVAAVVQTRVGGEAGSPTEHLELAPRPDVASLRARLGPFGVDDAAIERLARVYGPDASELAALIEHDPALARPIVPAQAPIRAEVVHAARYEQARALGDVLARRTRLVLLDHGAALAAAPMVADLMAAELDWGAAERERALADFAAESRQYGLPEWREAPAPTGPAPKKSRRRVRTVG